MVACRLLLAGLIGGALAGVFLVAPVAAKGTPAGTLIPNVASVTYRAGGPPVTTTSNTVTVRVQEILDVIVAPGSGDKPVSLPGDTGRAVPFLVTNSGNGMEKFALTLRTDIAGDNFDPVCPRLFIDADNSGSFEESKDTLYAAGTNDPDLAPDATVLVFALCDVPATASNNDLGNVSLEARARTLERPRRAVPAKPVRSSPIPTATISTRSSERPPPRPAPSMA